jgi:hypothetical protein
LEDEVDESSLSPELDADDDMEDDESGIVSSSPSSLGKGLIDMLCGLVIVYLTLYSLSLSLSLSRARERVE